MIIIIIIIIINNNNNNNNNTMMIMMMVMMMVMLITKVMMMIDLLLLLIMIIIFQKRHWLEKSFQKGHFAHIGNEIKICSQNKCYHHLSNVCENSFRMFHSNWVISDYHSFLSAVC